MPIIVNENKLRAFVKKVFLSYNLNDTNSNICTDNLVMADLRGIHSHGVARLQRYVKGIDEGLIFPLNKAQIIKETQNTANIDGNGGLGQVISHYSTNIAIQKAKDTGIGIVTVKNSNHYGIAGYYSNLILQENMIGISMTNSAPLVVPTFGRDMMFGTNPISFAAPGKGKKAFFLDMATSVVPRGKLEGCAVDAKGNVTQNPGEVLKNMLHRIGGGIMPLGGAGETHSGYKGYGLAVMVEILSGVLSGGAYCNLVYAKKDGKIVPPNVCHFFMALKVENFIDFDLFTKNMDDLIDRLKKSNKAEGQERIYIHGEKEYELYNKHKKEGIPVQEKVYDTLKEIAKKREIEFNLPTV